VTAAEPYGVEAEKGGDDDSDDCQVTEGTILERAVWGHENKE
jgi:hypothetical protein